MIFCLALFYSNWSLIDVGETTGKLCETVQRWWLQYYSERDGPSCLCLCCCVMMMSWCMAHPHIYIDTMDRMHFPMFFLNAFHRHHERFISVVVHGRSAIAVTDSMHNCSGHRNNVVPWGKRRTTMPPPPIERERHTWPNAMPMYVCCHHFQLSNRPSDRPDPALTMALPMLHAFALLRFAFAAIVGHCWQFCSTSWLVDVAFVCYSEKKRRK